MAGVWSAIQPMASKWIAALVMKQVENATRAVLHGLEDTIIGDRVHLLEKPLLQVRKEHVAPKVLAYTRSLSEPQKKRLEEKRKKKEERKQSVEEKKKKQEEIKEQVKKELETLKDNLEEAARNQVTNLVNKGNEMLADAVSRARGMFEAYKKVITDIGIEGEKTVVNSVDLVSSMLSAPAAILGTCAVGPTVTPGALAQFINAIKAKSDNLGTSLSKCKSGISELRGMIEGLKEVDLPSEEFDKYVDTIIDTLDTVETLLIAPETLIKMTGGLICVLNINLEEIAMETIEGLVGEMAGPLLALATNDATLCGNWRLKDEIAETMSPEEIIEFEADFTKYSWDNCGNFSAMEYEYEKDENGIPMKDPEGKFIYKLDMNGNKVPTKGACSNCKNYKKEREKEEE